MDIHLKMLVPGFGSVAFTYHKDTNTYSVYAFQAMHENLTSPAAVYNLFAG